MGKGLTPAERQLVELARLGFSNRQLARRRAASESTVANQLSAAYKKLGVTSRRELYTLLGGSDEMVGRHQALRRWLTPREQSVLRYAEAGQSNKVIAHALGIAISTVSTTLTRARRKLRLALSADAPIPRAHCATDLATVSEASLSRDAHKEWRGT